MEDWTRTCKIDSNYKGRRREYEDFSSDLVESFKKLTDDKNRQPKAKTFIMFCWVCTIRVSQKYKNMTFLLLF